MNTTPLIRRTRCVMLKSLLGLGLWIGVAPCPTTAWAQAITANSSTSAPEGNYCPGDPQKTGCTATFSCPEGVAVDSEGNVFVADSCNNTIRKITPSRAVTTLAGLPGAAGSTDAAQNAARFNRPEGVAVDGAGNVYVADRGNNTIRKVTPAGVVTTLAGLAKSPGHADGKGSAARFFYPQGVAVDRSGNVYVADTGNDEIRAVSPTGVVTTLAGMAGHGGTADGQGPDAQFYNPRGLAVDSSGNIYVADRGNSTIRKVTPEGAVTTLAGSAGHPDHVNGTGNTAHSKLPQGVAADQAGNIYVADALNGTICQISPSGAVIALAGLAGHYGSADGVAADGNTPVLIPGTNTFSVATSRN